MDKYTYGACTVYVIAQWKLLGVHAFPESSAELSAAQNYLHLASPESQVADLVVAATGLFLAILCFVWIYRLTNNLYACGFSALQITPGWSVGWFFVPVACLWKPYQAVSQLEKASRLGHGWNEGASHGAVLFWWVCCWGSFALLILAMIIAGDTPTSMSVSATRSAMFITVLSALIECAGWIVLLAILGKASQELSEQYGVPYEALFAPPKKG